MTGHGFIDALQFLTRLPTPRLRKSGPADLARAALWFPVVGLVIGFAIAAAVWAGDQASPWIAALLGLLMWVWITGALHLDGLADVSDALGAGHRSPERFIEVVHDPHIGAYGVIVIVLQLISKIVLLVPIAMSPSLLALVLVPAWARWGPLVWSVLVPPLSSGMGERFSHGVHNGVVIGYGLALTALSALVAPLLIAALAIVLGIAAFWKFRLGGLTGDCLGASIEVTETALLFVLVASILWT